MLYLRDFRPQGRHIARVASAQQARAGNLEFQKQCLEEPEGILRAKGYVVVADIVEQGS